MSVSKVSSQHFAPNDASCRSPDASRLASNFYHSHTERSTVCLSDLLTPHTCAAARTWNQPFKQGNQWNSSLIHTFIYIWMSFVCLTVFTVIAQNSLCLFCCIVCSLYCLWNLEACVFHPEKLLWNISLWILLPSAPKISFKLLHLYFLWISQWRNNGSAVSQRDPTGLN